MRHISTFFLLLDATLLFIFFLFNTTATTEIYTLSLHDVFRSRRSKACELRNRDIGPVLGRIFHGEPEATSPENAPGPQFSLRSEEHTSELQSRFDLVCRLLLEKKK